MNKLEDVQEALAEAEVHGLTVEEVRGFGRQQGQTAFFKGSTYALNLVPKLRLEIVLPDDLVEKAIKTIESSAKTGELGDGMIFVSDVENAYRIRTGEEGEDALSSSE